MPEKLDIDSLVQEGPFERDEVVRMIDSVVRKVSISGIDNEGAGIVSDIQELGQIIEQMRRDIGRSGVGDIKDKHIPTATDELDAVVGSTEDATGAIMDACEAIQGFVSESGGAVSDKIDAEVIKIFEACSFQDITGQRISKVVGTLKEIEAKVAVILDALGGAIPASSEGAGDATATDSEADLLNGPQMPGEGVSQSDVDKLLSDFD